MVKAAISTKEVSKTIGNKVLLENITFEIQRGTLTSLIGPNGAGKSTLVKIILGLDKAYTGSVHVEEPERVQYIPQQTSTDRHALPLSVEEFFSVATTGLHSLQKVTYDYEAALEHVQLSRDKLKQSVTSLSGGERQRVAIARALLLEPTILILDEPLAAVDYASRAGLYELIRHLQQDHAMTVLLVSHDIESVIALSDQILCLDKTLHTQCTPSEFANTQQGAKQGVINHTC